MSSGNARGLGFWIRRYLPSEIVGTATALAAAAISYRLSGSLFVAAIAGTIGENLGFYGVAGARNFAELWRRSRGDPGARRRSVIARTAWLSAVEFGPAELIDTLAVRPLLLWLAPLLLGLPAAGWIAGKIGADLVFYGIAGFGYVLGRRWDDARRQAGTPPVDDMVLSPQIRAKRIDAIRRSLSGIDLDALVTTHGSPLMLLDLGTVASQYGRLCAALPFVHWHYAVKALSHPEVIETIASLGGSFDVASDGEIDLVAGQNVTPDRIIHTQPIKSATEITRAYVLGIRTFVIDSPGELAKFHNVPANVSLLIRLAYRNPDAKSDLSSKFGVSPVEAEVLLSQAIAQGSHIAGFSFHVGSQLDSVDAFVRATTATLELMDRLEENWNVEFTTLDIGGGFPVGYRTEVASIEQIAGALRPLLEPRSPRLNIIAEPGRILVADAATLVSRVNGVRDRDGEAWCFIDDGVYGSYSNVVSEAVNPVILSRAELDGEESALVPTTVGGPTCDSADVVARRYPLPPLREGDLLLSPTMGAYTSVTATTFNGRRAAKVVVLERAVAVQRADALRLSTH
ncbi:type III PLP-dependent enzyme [Frigoribacterium sp. UYMn621]|uniref:type III PLP-dependent enzyme n=1 Tax=Frigoribacterium sp. UYMn621 TaxID=3156343 RepID=UPI0033941402